MEFVLNRTYYDQGTNGTLYYKGIPLCKTIELPWRNNERGQSCIPEGRYELKLRYTERFGRHYLVKHVANRQMILIHPFNHALKESRGCIAPVQTVTGAGKGYGSRAALDRMLEISRALHEEVVLVVRGAG